jgi:hypothetical protein
MTYYVGISSTMPLSSALCVSQCYEIWTSPRNHITPSFWLATEPQRHSTPRSIWGDEIRSHAAAQLAQRNNVAAQHRRAASLSALPRSPPPPAWLLRACGTSAEARKSETELGWTMTTRARFGKTMRACERALYDGRDQAKPGAIEGRPRGQTRCWRSRRHPSNNLQLLVVKTSHRGHPMERLKADRPRSLALAASTTGYRSGGAVQRCSGSRGVVGSPSGVRGKTSKGNCSEYFYSFLWSAGTGLVLYLAAAGKGLRDGCRSSRRRRVFVSWGPGLASEKPAPG